MCFTGYGSYAFTDQIDNLAFKLSMKIGFLMAKRNVGVKVEAPENGGRRLVITDIHGCAKTFKKLLDKVGLNENDQLFLLGDYINRGPSKQVIDKIIFFELQSKMDSRYFCLMEIMKRRFCIYCLKVQRNFKYC